MIGIQLELHHECQATWATLQFATMPHMPHSCSRHHFIALLWVVIRDFSDGMKVDL